MTLLTLYITSAVRCLPLSALFTSKVQIEEVGQHACGTLTGEKVTLNDGFWVQLCLDFTCPDGYARLTEAGSDPTCCLVESQWLIEVR